MEDQQKQLEQITETCKFILSIFQFKYTFEKNSFQGSVKLFSNETPHITRHVREIIPSTNFLHLFQCDKQG